jgi:hypothetical protein
LPYLFHEDIWSDRTYNKGVVDVRIFASVMQGAAGPRIAPGHCAAGSGTQWSKKLDAQAVSRATKEYLATLDDPANQTGIHREALSTDQS